MVLLTKAQLKKLNRINAELDQLLSNVKQKPLPAGKDTVLGREQKRYDQNAKECLEQSLRDASSNCLTILRWLDT